jgi:hypothetical protein
MRTSAERQQATVAKAGPGQGVDQMESIADNRAETQTLLSHAALAESGSQTSQLKALTQLADSSGPVQRLSYIQGGRSAQSGAQVVQREGDDVATASQPAVAATESAPAMEAGPQPDPALLERINQNRGLVEMAKNAQAILAKSSIWDAVAKKPSATGDAVIAAGGVTGGLTTASGAATGTIAGTAAKNASMVPDSGVQTDFVQDAAANIVSSVGAGISGLFSAVKSAKNIYAAFKDKDAIAGTAGARDLLATLQSGFICAQEVLKYVSGSVPTAVAAAIPGIGIAVSAANIIVNAYNGLKAASAEAEMSEVSGAYRQQLAALLGREPESNNKLMDTEKRGKFGSRQEYLRLTPGAKDSIAKALASADPEATFATEKAKYGIPESVTFAAFHDAVRSYEMGSKLQEINQKRKVYSGREISADLVAIAGDIAAFFPADGGITAVTLKGVASGAKAAQGFGKFIQGQARNAGSRFADSNRSADVKHSEYVDHTKTIYSLLAGVGLAGKPDSDITSDDITKAKSAEKLIEAAGASTSVAYNTDYGSDASVLSQVNLIVEAMKKGR